MKKKQVIVLIVLPILLSVHMLHADGSGKKKQSENSTNITLESYYKPLAPEKIHTSTGINIYKNLEHKHFRSIDINDDFSRKMLDKYLEDLDSSKLYFLASDIRSFEVYRTQLDNAIKKGDLKPAYDIFNRYQQRLIERLIYSIKNIDCCFDKIDFTTNDTYDTERKKAPWAANRKELDDIWNKRLKNEILNMKLSDKPEKNIAEALKKRYKNQLSRISQTKSEDAFRTYINSFTRMYDPHTQYFSPRASEDFNIRMSLSLEGIGALLQTENEHTKVVRLITAGPADKSGLLKAGDRIVAVGQGAEGDNLVDVTGWRLDDVVQLIRGPKNTVVRLKIIPSTSTDDHHTKIIRLTRNTVKLEEQAAKKSVVNIADNNQNFKIGVITIPTFYIDFNAFQSGAPDYKSTTRDVKKLLEELKAEKVDGVIIDLRENGGGALHEATSLTGLFIKTGPTVIVKSSKNNLNIYPDDDPDISYSGPLAVLVNRMSASASEIFAGAIRDHNRGIILGSQTFGKGTVQSLLDLNKGQLKITIAKFYRIQGESTQHKGIIPDISFPSLYNTEEIGESALSEALPWDKTTPARFRQYMNVDLKGLVEKLQVLHEKRTKNSPDFKYLTEYNNHFKELEKKKVISLNEKQRMREQKEAKNWALKLENTLRQAKGEKPYANYEALKKAQDKENSEDEFSEKKNGNDVVLKESQNILADYIRLLKG